MTRKLTREDVQLSFANDKKQDTVKTFICAECIILFSKTEKRVLCKWQNTDNFYDRFLVRSRGSRYVTCGVCRVWRAKRFVRERVEESRGGGFTSSNLTRFSSFKALAIKQNWSLEDEFTFININRKSAGDIVRSRCLHISESTDESCLFRNCIYMKEFDLI